MSGLFFFLGMGYWFFVTLMCGDEINMAIKEFIVRRAGHIPCTDCGRASTIHGDHTNYCQSCYERLW